MHCKRCTMILPMRLDGCPSPSRIYVRPSGAGLTFYVEVRDVGVMAIPAETVDQHRGSLGPRGLKLLRLDVLDRLAKDQTPLPAPPDPPDAPPALS